MIKRYRHIGGIILVNTHIGSNTQTGSTTSTATFTTVLSGEPGAVVTLNVSAYSHTAPGAAFIVDGTTYVLGNTFTKTLDGTGNYTMIQVLDVGTLTAGNFVSGNLHITATTIGIVDPTNNLTSNSKST